MMGPCSKSRPWRDALPDSTIFIEIAGAVTEMRSLWLSPCQSALAGGVASGQRPSPVLQYLVMTKLMHCSVGCEDVKLPDQNSREAPVSGWRNAPAGFGASSQMSIPRVARGILAIKLSARGCADRNPVRREPL